MTMTRLSTYEIDRLFRNFPDDDGLWLMQPMYDPMPRAKAQPDELPARVLEHMNLSEALDRTHRNGGLTGHERDAFRAVVMGIIRVPTNDYRDWVEIRVEPMTYELCARYMGVSDNAVKHALMRARRRLAVMLSE